MPIIRFEMDDIEYDAALGEKVADIARKAGSSIPFGCTNGICGTCIVDVTSGADNLSEQDDEEAMTLEMFGADKPTHRLACQCKLEGDVTIDNP